MPQLEEIRGGPRSAAAPAPFPAQDTPPGYPPGWYPPGWYPPAWYTQAPVGEPPALHTLPPVAEPPAPDGPPQKLAYSVDEAAQALGVSRSTVYTLIHRADFPALKVGNRQLISREGLAEWVRKQAGMGRG